MSDEVISRGSEVGTVVSPARVVGVTVGLGIASAVAGGLVANAVLAIALLVTQGPLAVFRDPLVYLVGGAVGGVCGLVCGPIAAWTLLRKVPLGRAILEPSVAAAIGGAIGLLLAEPRGIWGPVGGALAGLLLAAIRLRREYRNKA